MDLRFEWISKTNKADRRSKGQYFDDDHEHLIGSRKGKNFQTMMVIWQLQYEF